jgi:type 2 lantibiotic biosynthesis protein LanM
VWSLGPLPVDFYGGLSGIALFLAYLGAVTGEDCYTSFARSTVSGVRRQLHLEGSAPTYIGGFNGRGGVIYTLSHLGCLWGESELLDEAAAIADGLPHLIERDEQLDVIGGSAGCIGSLLSLHKVVPSRPILEYTISCGDRILDQSRPMESGIGWVSQAAGDGPLAGFSHGAAGIGWALLKLAAASDEPRFLAAAQGGMAYERTLFCPQAGNWLDLRDHPASGEPPRNEDHAFMTSWCHGAPGIGLARLSALSIHDDTESRNEIAAALKTTRAQGFGRNHSLCHGDLGNLELVIQARDAFGDPDLDREVRTRAGIIAGDINHRGFLCGIPGGAESPGLMTGVAGIGYGFLRLAEPTLIPSVLILEPPKVGP